MAVWLILIAKARCVKTILDQVQKYDGSLLGLCALLITGTWLRQRAIAKTESMTMKLLIAVLRICRYGVHSGNNKLTDNLESPRPNQEIFFIASHITPQLNLKRLHTGNSNSFVSSLLQSKILTKN